MDYVKSEKSEKYYNDMYYYITFTDGIKGTIRYASYGRWEFINSEGHEVYGLFNSFHYARPNTKLGALVELYRQLHRYE